MPQIAFEKLDDTTYEIPQSGRMKVPGRIIADDELMKHITADNAPQQVVNVACLPGIVGHSLAMPDMHWGYGFPIGGVAATDPDQGGVVSPGGVGYDINCGCRLMTTALPLDEVRDALDAAARNLYHDIPCGVGSEGAIAKLGSDDIDRVLREGAGWAVSEGYGTEADLETTEERGCLAGADPGVVSRRAKSRGASQVGTLGSGNHFAEIGYVDAVFDEETARVFGVSEGTVTVMIHSGSRGLGYQVCDDSLKTMQRAAAKYQIELPDRQLCCAPVHSHEGREYLGAMAAAANFAWANRQVMMELARRSLCKTFAASDRDLQGRLVYDVCHNIAKLEVHEVNGVRRRVCVHRKGATRAFPGSRSEVPAAYRGAGQPVLVPGDMGTASYVCAGTDTALAETFGSACHGAGRAMSRSQSKKRHDPATLLRELGEQGVVVLARSKKTVAEEASGAYKDVHAVVDVTDRAGIARRVARIRPMAVIKG